MARHCEIVEIDGVKMRVQVDGNLDDSDRAALAEILKAATRAATPVPSKIAGVDFRFIGTPHHRPVSREGWRGTPVGAVEFATGEFYGDN
jgi:hypothetical protein